MNKSLKKNLPLKTSAFLFCLGMFALTMSTAFAQQGVVRMLYTVPNSTFIENPAGDSGVVTINDTSGSISTLQTSINNARSSNPNSIIINLHSSLVLEDPGSSTNRTTQMDQWASNGGSNQKWVLLKQ